MKEFVLIKVPYQERPLRHEYRLTQKGLDLYPVVMSIVHWGRRPHGGKEGPAAAAPACTACGKTF